MLIFLQNYKINLKFYKKATFFIQSTKIGKKNGFFDKTLLLSQPIYLCVMV